jgi:hypothetical protein
MLDEVVLHDLDWGRCLCEDHGSFKAHGAAAANARWRGAPGISLHQEF